MDRLFLDTNVILDVLERRAPWFPDALECLHRVEGGKAKGALSALSLSDMAYIQRGTSPEALAHAFSGLRRILDVASLDASSVDRALARALPDFEDGLQWEAALGWRATHFLTRNTKDFPRSGEIRVLSARDYIMGS